MTEDEVKKLIDDFEQTEADRCRLDVLLKHLSTEYNSLMVILRAKNKDIADLSTRVADLSNQVMSKEERIQTLLDRDRVYDDPKLNAEVAKLSKARRNNFPSFWKKQEEQTATTSSTTEQTS